jgi:hypothetical protein
MTTVYVYLFWQLSHLLKMWGKSEISRYILDLLFKTLSRLPTLFKLCYSRHTDFRPVTVQGINKDI